MNMCIKNQFRNKILACNLPKEKGSIDLFLKKEDNVSFIINFF